MSLLLNIHTHLTTTYINKPWQAMIPNSGYSTILTNVTNNDTDVVKKL